MGPKVIILAKSLIPIFLRACAIVQCYDSGDLVHLEEGNVCEPVVANSVQLSFSLSFFSFLLSVSLLSLSISLLSFVIEEGDVRLPAVADCVQPVCPHHCHPGLF